MAIKGVIFDVNGTLIDIETDEHCKRVYRSISRYLSYQGIHHSRSEIKDEYFRIMREQRKASSERHPEYDAVEVWRELLRRKWNASPGLCPTKMEQMPVFLADMFRGVSRRRLKLYPGVRRVLDELRHRCRLAVISDGQRAWALPEMRTVGIDAYFDPIVVSGDYGFRKPDPRLFEQALVKMGLAPWEVLYVGNDMYRDIYGPKQLGIKTVFFSSNQGRKHMDGVAPDYIIYNFEELHNAINFLGGN